MRFCEINDIASVASELARGLRARGHEVDLLQPRLAGGSLPSAVKPLVGPVRALEWARIIRTVRNENYDTVHIHYAYLGMLGVLGRFPYILHCHGSDVREVAAYARPLVARALAGAACVFYATPDLEPLVRNRRPDARFLPNPIDTAQFRPLAPAAEREGVLVICSLAPVKGAGRILAACRLLAERRPDIRITVIEGGPYTPRFAALPNITVVPRQLREDLPGLISRHGLAIGQQRLGSLGMAELEAMACARPLVAAFRYGSAYPEPPPLVRTERAADIADAVTRLADDPAERERAGREARAWVEHNHGLDAAAAAVEAAALEILARKRRPAGATA
jgi:glycosyltransferase involved in cell wall biosynthesis